MFVCFSGSGSILDPECSLLAKRFNRTLGPLVHSGSDHHMSGGGGEMRRGGGVDHMNNPYERWSNGSDGIGNGASQQHSSSKSIFGNGENNGVSHPYVTSSQTQLKKLLGTRNVFHF